MPPIAVVMPNIKFLLFIWVYSGEKERGLLFTLSFRPCGSEWRNLICVRSLDFARDDNYLKTLLKFADFAVLGGGGFGVRFWFDGSVLLIGRTGDPCIVGHVRGFAIFSFC